MKLATIYKDFRVFAQQMGMQAVRGVLNESIDVYLNAAINDVVRQSLISGVQNNIRESGTMNVSTMSNVNEFKNLYHREKLELLINDVGYLNFETLEDEDGNIHYEIDLSKHQNLMMLLGASIQYGDSDGNRKVSCRLVSVDDLENTLADYCNTASKYYPIACLRGNILEIYTNSKTTVGNFYIEYISKPSEIDNHNYENNHDCEYTDLPDYMMHEVIELAVRKWYISIHGQPAEQPQNGRAVQ